MTPTAPILAAPTGDFVDLVQTTALVPLALITDPKMSLVSLIVKRVPSQNNEKEFIIV